MIEKSDDIAVIIPSYARADRLRSCLNHLAAQDGGPYPTYVVDDGSPEPMAPICDGYPWVTCLRQDNAGPAKARNAGAEAAQAAGARFLCFTDDDCRPRPGWVRALIAAQGEEATRLVGGHVENALDENVYAAASQTLCDYLYAYFDAAAGDAPFFTSNNMGCDAQRFTGLGGFDDTFPLAAAEDRDFGLRWRDRVGPLSFAPEAVVDHAHPLTLGRFWRQHANYGRGARHLHRTMSARGDERPRREPAAFYTGLVLHPMREHRPAALRQSALMGLSQIAMVVGYTRERRSET